MTKFTNKLLTWENPATTGATFVLGNILLFSIAMELPLFAYAVSYGGFAALGAGAVAKLALKMDSCTLDEVLPLDLVQSLVEQVYKQFSCVFAMLAPVIFWKDPAVSGAAALGFYVFSGVADLLSIVTMSLLIFNGVFLYGKFQNEIVSVVGPHLCTVKKQVMGYLNKIPKYEKKELGAKKK